MQGRHHASSKVNNVDEHRPSYDEAYWVVCLGKNANRNISCVFGCAHLFLVAFADGAFSDPTPAPVDLPTPAPMDLLTPAPVDSPTPAPVDPPSPAPVNPRTPAPVDPSTTPTDMETLFDLHNYARCANIDEIKFEYQIMQNIL